MQRETYGKGIWHRAVRVGNAEEYFTELYKLFRQLLGWSL